MSKNFIAATFIILSLISTNIIANTLDQYVDRRLDIIPAEVFIAVYPQTGLINIIEYDLQVVAGKSDSLEKNVEKIKTDIKGGEFSPSRYLFEKSSIAEEKIYLDEKRNIVIGDYWIKTENKNLELFEDVFTVFLQKEVTVAYSDRTLSVMFKKNRLKPVSTEHGTIYENDTHQKIVWSDGSPNYDAVFAVERATLSMDSISQYFSVEERIGSEGVYIDGSTAQSYVESMLAMAKGARPEALKEFEIAILKISLDISGTASSADDVSHNVNELLGKKLNKMTFNEVLDLGATIKANKETRNIIKDFKETGTSKDYQHDADIVRLQHISYLGDLIERYIDITGAYPLASDEEKYVFFVSPSQEQYASGNKMFKDNLARLEEFKDSIESVLDIEMIIPFDPQLEPVNKPTFYVYRADKSGYTLTGHLFSGKGISKKINKYYYELNISNNEIKKDNIYTYQTISNMTRFKKRISAQFKIAAPKNPEQQGVIVN